MGLPEEESATGGDVGAGRLADVLKSSVLFPVFLHETAGDEILKLLVGPKAKHFLSSAHRVASLEILVNYLKEVVEPESLLVGKHYYQLVCDVIWHPS